MSKNIGEYDELRIKLRLIELRDKNNSVTIGGKEFNITSVGLKEEFVSLPEGTNLRAMTDFQIEKLAIRVGAGKADKKYKADVNINGEGFSIKSHKSAPPAVVNHTPRWGWYRVCQQLEVDINQLDSMVKQYLQMRQSGEIHQDIYNSDPMSPFKYGKEYLRPLLNYFLFTGTGARDSKYPAKYILDCEDPYDINTWKIYDENDYVDIFWNKMQFSVRRKGFEAFPYKRRCDKWKTPLSEPWAVIIDGVLKGALHVRVK